MARRTGGLPYVTAMDMSAAGGGRRAPAAILDADMEPVAAFLHRELNPAVTTDAWARGMRASWSTGSPNHGFVLVAA